ncbi:MAG: COG1361 S-layer family protein [Candidatus Methanomethylicaceae archaeon]
MKCTTIILISILFLAASPSVIKCEGYNFAVKDVSWRTLNVGFGNSTCVVLLMYYGDSPCSNIEGSLDVSKVSSSYSRVSDRYSDTIENGRGVYLEFTFDVASTKVGWYSAPLTVNYIKDGRIVWESFTIILTINGAPDINVFADQSMVVRGYINDLPIVIRNDGDGLARRVTVTIQTQDIYLTILGENEINRDFLAPNESWWINVSAFAQLSIRDGTSLTINVRYEDQEGVAYTETTTLGLKVEDPDMPRIEICASTTRIRPGITNYVVLTIKNSGGSCALDLTIKATPTSNQLTLVGNNTFLVSRLDTGEAFGLPLSLYLAPQTYGSLPVYVTIGYKDDRNSTYQDSISIGFLSEEEPEPRVEVMAREAQLQPNMLNKITIILENKGERMAKDLRVNLASQSPEIAIVVGTGIAHVDNLGVGDVWKVEKQVFVQPKVYGAIPLYVQVQYQDDLQNRYSYTTTLGFEVKGMPSVVVSSVIYTPSPVFPGNKAVRANCVIVNHGNYTAQDISMVLGNISGVITPSYAGSDRVKIPFLTVGGSANVQFLVDIDEGAKPGYYEVPLSISTSSENILTTLPLTVAEKAKIQVEKLYFDREVLPGTRNVKLFIEVSNVGNVTAGEVRVSVISGYITGSTRYLLGTMASGSRKVIVMEVDVDSKASPGELPVDVEVSWTQDGRSMSETSTMKVVISETPNIEVWWAVLMLILLVIGGVIFKKKLILIVRSISQSLKGR